MQKQRSPHENRTDPQLDQYLRSPCPASRGRHRVLAGARSAVPAGLRRVAKLQQHRNLKGQDGLRSVWRSEEHTSELQSLMRISYAVFCLKKKKPTNEIHITSHT